MAPPRSPERHLMPAAQQISARQPMRGNDGESSLFGYHAPNPTSLADLRSQARGRPLCDQIAAENVLSTACVLLRNLGFTAPEKG
ncbi:hypothetical protein PJI17_14375 [Mycobacterium kansasii]|uniref:Uncharacterized protein n=4 Tax=Mycobacterium kansasii TaxID=1768 RepID=A0A7G1IFZ1_MYCKA|nr:hypothetical protein NIIDMKKI_52120 [Mycobacterium kansasii]